MSRVKLAVLKLLSPYKERRQDSLESAIKIITDKFERDDRIVTAICLVATRALIFPYSNLPRGIVGPLRADLDYAQHTERFIIDTARASARLRPPSTRWGRN